MNARWRPYRIGRRHLSNQGADPRIDWRTTLRSMFGPPSPSAAELVAMPPHHGVGLDEHQRRAPIAPAMCQGDPKTVGHGPAVAPASGRVASRPVDGGELH